jgi:hypothetical protein
MKNQRRPERIVSRAIEQEPWRCAAGSYLLCGDQLCEMLEGAVIGSFCAFREKAARQLPFLQVVGNAVAADSFAGAGFVGAAADVQIFIFFAVQCKYSFGKLTSNERRATSEKP